MPCQCADARRAYCESACKPSSVPRLAGLADTAGVAAIRLHRRLPDGSSDRTRGPAEPADVSSYWSCSGWGLPGRPVSRAPVGSYPHHFTFAGAFQRRPCLFCGTLLRVAPTGRYPAPCSAELGLSSKGSLPPRLPNGLANSFYPCLSLPTLARHHHSADQAGHQLESEGRPERKSDGEADQGSGDRRTDRDAGEI